MPISKRRWLRNGHSSSRQGTNAILWAPRGVDENELIAGAGQDLPLSRETPGAAKVLSDTDVAALFGLEMADTGGFPGF